MENTNARNPRRRNSTANTTPNQNTGKPKNDRLGLVENTVSVKSLAYAEKESVDYYG